LACTVGSAEYAPTSYRCHLMEIDPIDVLVGSFDS
jgi:hypothetical protein